MLYCDLMEARKLASRLLEDHGHERQFEVRIDDFYDLELVAERMREMGCVVSVETIRRTLSVECPEPSTN